ncbi:MAG: hypothetical protein ACI37R_03755 [Candidatus Avigastranaerophilus sp.]
MTIIIGIKLNDKGNNAIELQRILTDFGCDIKLRIGINNASFLCSDTGIILLQVENRESAIRLENSLINISGIELERMIF